MIGHTRPARSIILVYARRSREGAEPLVAVLADESELRRLRAEFAERWPQVEVRWEDQPVHGPYHPSDEVYLVVQGEPSDPVVAGAHSTRESAERTLDAEGSRTPGHTRLLTARVGWRVEGRPWEGD